MLVNKLNLMWCELQLVLQVNKDMCNLRLFNFKEGAEKVQLYVLICHIVVIVPHSEGHVQVC